MWSNCLLDLGTDFLVGNMEFRLEAKYVKLYYDLLRAERVKSLAVILGRGDRDYCTLRYSTAWKTA